MKFTDILCYLNEGKKAKRKKWSECERGYIYFDDKGGIVYTNPTIFPLRKEDYNADDWEVYSPREYFDFNKAYKLMKEGKKVLRKALEPKEKVSCYIFLEDGCFLGGINRTYYFYKLKQDDIEAKDWFVVE